MREKIAIGGRVLHGKVMSPFDFGYVLVVECSQRRPYTPLKTV